MILAKIKHKATGLFLRPSSQKVRYNPYRVWKTNLTKRGKLYEFSSLEAAKNQISGWYRTYYDHNGDTQRLDWNDFEIVQF